MNKTGLTFYFTLFILHYTSGQTPGEWTWMNGDTIPNAPAVFGIQGVPAAANNPPSFYEACEWTDHLGNLWLYGGLSGPFIYADLWKYDPIIYQWTWVHGTGTTGVGPFYGTQGVPSPQNTPGSRGIGVSTWVDQSGNLWLFGGAAGTYYNDLWKYDVLINEWTWMGGGTGPGNYGILGVPSPSNLPPERIEACASWSDNQNNLWLYGGGDYGDLWCYSITTGLWTWMSGSNITFPPAIYGSLGIGSTANSPGWRWTYAKWKDSNDNFWLWGGSTGWNSIVHNDLWKYNPSTNEWTWVQGPDTSGDLGVDGPLCTEDIAYRPSARTESRACWTDNCENFWLFGGFRVSASINTSSDLWKYNSQSGKWSLVSGTTNSNYRGNHGVKGTSAATNHPQARFGNLGWKDLNGNFWIFGGSDSSGSNAPYNDLWRYIPDSSCTCSLMPVASVSAMNPLCPGACANFINLSVNASAYQWFFPGASPDTSTAVNPTNICYINPGNYDVQLIAANANGSDTLLLSNFITVFPTPPPQSIIQSGDTLFANAGASAYQRFYNGNSIPGATGYFYVAQVSGDYNVVATDQNGCEVEAVINDVIAGLNQFPSDSYGDSGSQLTVFPNPVNESFEIQGLVLRSADEISIYNVVGEKLFSTFATRAMGSQLQITIPITIGRRLADGMYYLEISSAGKIYRTKFLKQ